MTVSELHAAVLQMIEILVEIDPDPKSPEGKLLEGLASAAEEYEKAKENQ